jgi:hypothetical protein
MELEKDKIRCDCGEWARPHKFHIEGFIVRGWKCPKCEEEYFSGDIEKVLLLNKLKKHPLAVKVGKLGESKIILNEIFLQITIVDMIQINLFL